MKNLDDVIKGTTMENPYDARNAGPMCEQSNRSPESVDDLNETNMNDALANILAVFIFLAPWNNYKNQSLIKMSWFGNFFDLSQDIDIPDSIPDNLVSPESILTILEEVRLRNSVVICVIGNHSQKILINKLISYLISIDYRSGVEQ